MNHPGDSLVLTLSVQKPDGTSQVVTGTPSLTVVNAVTGAPVTSPALSMAAIPGTTGLYTATWNTAGSPAGSYLALVSYASDAGVFNGHFLSPILLGDSFMTGPVALDATVAKDSSVAKDATVLKTSGYLSPDQSPLVQQISTQLVAFQAGSPSQDSFNQLFQVVQNLSDFAFGNWVIDKTTNVMSYFRENGALLKKYLLSNSASESNRLQQR